jgi:hypothetical protein
MRSPQEIWVKTQKDQNKLEVVVGFVFERNKF